MKIKTLLFVPVFLVLALLLAPWGTDVAKAQMMKKVTVLVPNPSAITWLPMWVAIGEGYFKDAGLEINVEAVDGSSQVLQSMASGQAQIGAPGPGPVLTARSRGVGVVYIYNLYPKSVFGLVVRRETPYQKPVDLKGKVIGVGTADGAEVSFVSAILNDLGLVKDRDFTFLPVGDGGMAAAAFTRGDVEAYAAAVSDAAILEARGIGLREITPDQYLAYFGNGFAVTASYLKSNRKDVEGFGQALVRGMRFSLNKANKSKALAHAKAGNPQEGEDAAFAAALMDAVVGRMTPLDRSKGFGYMPPEHWELWQKSQVESGGLKAPLKDLKAAYTNEFISTWNR